MKKLSAALSILALTLIGLITAPAILAAYPTGSDANQASNWNNQFPHPATCYKHEAGDDSEHGTYSEDGKTFTLATFNQDWVGDHWEAIIVKAGSEASVENPNLVTVHPTAGTAYPAPDGKDISHVIVCKGTTPPPTPTPTPVVTPTPTPVVTPTPTPVVTPTPTPVVTATPSLPVISQFAVEPAVCRLDDPQSRIRIRVLVGIIALTDVDFLVDGDLVTASDIEFDSEGQAFIPVAPGVHTVTLMQGEDVLAEATVDCPTCFGTATTEPPTKTAPPTDVLPTNETTGTLPLVLVILGALGAGMLLTTRVKSRR